MNAADSRPLIDPFGQDRVTNPRQVGRTLDSLNGEVIDNIVGAIERVRERPESATTTEKAQLVLSPAPGYGKSHLIGRLFTRLSGKVTFINVQPFENLELVWHSVMTQVLNELQYPDGVVVEDAQWRGKLQLELFAEGVLRNLISRCFLNGKIKHEAAGRVAEWVGEQAQLDLISGNDEWSQWIRKNFFDQLHENCCDEVDKSGVTLERGIAAWLKVLFHIATSSRHSNVRAVCRAWLRGDQGDSKRYAAIGLQHDEPKANDHADTLNTTCRSTVRDLCVLSIFHRPFVFCFDQTENYTVRPGLVKQFGNVLITMLNLFPHQVVVVTANKSKWDIEVDPHFEGALKARITEGNELRGMNADEAREFVKLRFEANGTPTSKVLDFGLERWLERHFPKGGRNEMAPREFLRHCSNHWNGIKVEIRESLEEIYARLCNEHEANPRGVQYNPDVLRWLVGHPLASHPELQVCEIKDDNPYLELMWSIPGRAAVRFNFAHGNSESHLVWKALADRAQRNARSDAVLVSKVVVFLTPDLSQSKIPRPTWRANGPAIASARQSVLHLITLGLEEAAPLYAARELQLKVQAKDITGFTLEEVGQFLAKKLQHWREIILQPMAVPPVREVKPAGPAKSREAPVAAPKKEVKSKKVARPKVVAVPKRRDAEADGMVAKVLLIVKKEKFIKLEEVLHKLGGVLSKQQLLELCDEIPGIQKAAHPNSIVLIWHG